MLDANGMRVRKQTGSDWTEYGVLMRAPRQTASPSRWARADRRLLRAHPCGSEVIAEKDQADAWTDYIFAGGKRIAKAPGVASTSGTEYYSRGPQRLPPLGWRADHLGSARLMTDASGNPVANSVATMLPYGQQYETAVGTNHYKFTGKERDGESGLDYFGARYYGSTMGRWMSADWSEAPTPVPYANFNDPQTLNLYGYVGNRPITNVDADGHDGLLVVDKKTGQATIVIPVQFSGSGATPAAKAAIINRVNSLKIKGSRVKIKVVGTNQPMNGVLNKMDYSPGYDFKNYPIAGEGVNKMGGDKGHINSSNADGEGAAAHDILHFVGIEDKYQEGQKDQRGNRTSTPTPGYTNANLMTDRSGTEIDASQVQEAQKNKTTKQCTTDKGTTTCTK